MAIGQISRSEVAYRADAADRREIADETRIRFSRMGPARIRHSGLFLPRTSKSATSSATLGPGVVEPEVGHGVGSTTTGRDVWRVLKRGPISGVTPISSRPPALGLCRRYGHHQQDERRNHKGISMGQRAGSPGIRRSKICLTRDIVRLVEATMPMGRDSVGGKGT